MRFPGSALLTTGIPPLIIEVESAVISVSELLQAVEAMGISSNQIAMNIGLSLGKFDRWYNLVWILLVSSNGGYVTRLVYINQ
jgi:trehalose-6-phosphatase